MKLDKYNIKSDITGQRLENKLDRILLAMEEGFKRIDTDINWLKLIIVAIVLPLVVAVISLALPHLGK